MAIRTKLHFSRFEFKYVFPEHVRRDIESEFQYFVELDPHVAGKPGSKYFVRSLYYDDRSFSNYYEKIDGMMRRAKFRVRTYTDDPEEDCPQFLEIKGRYNNLVFKHRTPLDPSLGTPPPFWSPLWNEMTTRVLESTADGPIKNQFLFELERKRLEPVMLVDYWRRPYLSKYDPEFRLTFDDGLSGTACAKLFPSAAATTRRVLAGYTILEVKFRFHLPKWFHRLIQSKELRRVSISKYCVAVDSHRLTPKLD